MRIEMEFEGLEELVKAFEKAASDDARVVAVEQSLKSYHKRLDGAKSDQ